MSTTSTSSRRSLVFVVLLIALLLLAACGKKETAPPATKEQTQQPATTAAAPAASPDDLPAPSSDVKLPTAFGRRTGDLDEMAKSRNIRALVLINPISFFYDKGSPTRSLRPARWT